MHKGYSLVQYDLSARTDLTIRKNLLSGDFEIVKISGGKVRFSGSLRFIVTTANMLEGGINTWIV